MKKILSIFLFLIYFNNSFTYTNKDYNLFLDGKKAYYNRNYSLAKLNFETLLKTFPSSTIISNNYAYFFIGMNYYYLEDYENAAYYLEKAVYVSNKFLNDNAQTEKLHLFAERDFALGVSLLKIGQKEKAITYLNRVESNTFYPFVAYYEKKALEILKDFSPQYEKKLQLKFEYNFDVIDDFYTSDLLEIGKFYTSKKDFQHATELYTLLLKKDNLFIEEKEDIYRDYFEALLAKKDYNKILDLTKKIDKDLNNLFKYYRGIAFYKKRDFSRALYLFNSIKEGEFFSKANYYSAGIYFTLGEYSNAIENLKNVEEKNIITDSMAAFSYLYLKDEVNSLKAVQSLSEKYPNTYAGLYFKQLLKDKNLSVTLMDSLEDLIVFSNLILSSQISLSQDFIPKADILEIDQLSQIAELENREILKIAFQKSSFNKKKSVEAVLGTTLILESGKFYDLAFKNSLLALKDFADYKELFKYEFPLYYGDIISEYSKKYDVPQELIYTIIHTITGFNPYYISDDSKFGIMNIPYKDDSSLRFFELFDVNTNIEEGTKILKTLLDKYKGNKIKTLLAYVYGEEYLDLIYFGHTNDINFTSITIPEERFFLQNMFMTYIFYSRLYDF